MKTHTARIHDLQGLLNALYPQHLAEEWDNVGLHVGDPSAKVDRVLVCLDPDEAALQAALAAGAQALISHHPLVFQPIRTLTPSDAAGRVLFRAVREGVAVLCAHTNLDRAQGGLNDWLAERLGIEAPLPLAPGNADLLKLVVFVPVGYEDGVAQALFQGGAGQIGNYGGCSFQGAGTGTFRPGEGTRPFLGRPGELERAKEVRLETIVPKERLRRVLEKLLKAHPYEEVAYDLIPLENRRPAVGLGRIGRLAEPSGLDRFADRVKHSLGVPSVRVVGAGETAVRKVALCGGSGGSLLGEAIRQGADVLVTGDVKYHEAKRALAEGVALIDAGHFATERLMVQGLAEAMRRRAGERRLDVQFIEMEGEEDPFRTV